MKWRVKVRRHNGNHGSSRPTPSRSAAATLYDALTPADGTFAWLQAWYTTAHQVWPDGRSDYDITTWHNIEERPLKPPAPRPDQPTSHDAVIKR